ncbi:MAG TPA: helix-turn-helix transcriptional regulator [Terriglobales bacterium]|jgi:cytoskeletal protein RodZ
MSFGIRLKRERERRNVSLADIASATKISKRYLTALEDEDLERLPGTVYSKGFLRTVALHLRLPAALTEELMKDFEVLSAPPAVIEEAKPAPRQSLMRRLLSARFS